VEPESTDPFFNTVHKTVGSLYGKKNYRSYLYACMHHAAAVKPTHGFDGCTRCCCLLQNLAEVVGKGIATAATLKAELGQMRLVVLVSAFRSVGLTRLVGFGMHIYKPFQAR
jgi:hypothetical protein